MTARPRPPGARRSQTPDPPHESDAGSIAGKHDEAGSASRSEASDDARDAEAGTLIRSEERLQVGTERVEAGRARLRKHVDTETVTRTVAVSHEQLRIQREPLGAGASAQAGVAGLSELEHEFVLVAEEPVVQKDVVPVERVRLDTVTVTEEQTVTEQVRKEQIEVDQTGRQIDGSESPTAPG